MQTTSRAARRDRWLPIAVMLASPIATTGAFALLPAPALHNLVSESGALEIGTALLYVVLLGVLLVYGSRSGLGLIPAMVTALMLARELDLHRGFSAKGISSIGFYTDATIPLGARV